MRTLSIKNVLDKKHQTFAFEGVWKDIFGTPSTHGAWICYGIDKNGKTMMALIASEYLSKFERVLYVSGEEGYDYEFQNTLKRVGIDPANRRIHIVEYEPVEEIKARLRKRKAPRIVVMDNITIYMDELKNGGLRKLLKEFPNTLFIFLAHEDRNEPYTATAKLCRKLAKVIIRVQGLAAIVGGRCPGGRILIDENKAQIYHGTPASQNA